MNIKTKGILLFSVILNIVCTVSGKSEIMQVKGEKPIRNLSAQISQNEIALPDPSPLQSDIDAFWKATIQRLSTVPMDAKLEALPKPLPYREFKVTLSSLDGVKINALLSIPVQGEAPAKPWPVVVTVPGYGGWQQGVMLSECQRGYAILQVFPRGQGESEALWKVKGDKLTMNIDQPEGAYYQGAYADVIRAIDYVSSRKDLAADRISLVGTSQGGGIALAVGSLDPRVKMVVAHVPFLCNFRLAAQIPKSLVKTILDKAKANNESSLRTLDYFDPMQLVRKLKGRHVLVSAGGKDETCPIQTIQSVYAEIPGKKKLKIYPNLVHTSSLDFYNESWKWLNRYL